MEGSEYRSRKANLPKDFIRSNLSAAVVSLDLVPRHGQVLVKASSTLTAIDAVVSLIRHRWISSLRSTISCAHDTLETRPEDRNRSVRYSLAGDSVTGEIIGLWFSAMFIRLDRTLDLSERINRSPFPSYVTVQSFFLIFSSFAAVRDSLRPPFCGNEMTECKWRNPEEFWP